MRIIFCWKSVLRGKFVFRLFEYINTLLTIFVGIVVEVRILCGAVNVLRSMCVRPWTDYRPTTDSKPVLNGVIPCYRFSGEVGSFVWPLIPIAIDSLSLIKIDIIGCAGAIIRCGLPNLVRIRGRVKCIQMHFLDPALLLISYPFSISFTVTSFFASSGGFRGVRRMRSHPLGQRKRRNGVVRRREVKATKNKYG